ncbi:MAG: restriction endonuclease, partial [Pseudomonadota bacterium]|nr:restriction endonuclease [Pseudomonadota bacterium]
MNNHAIGQDYEDFVETVYKAILEAERRQGKTAPVTIERNKIITSKSGTPAEIDIYWEYQVAGITHRVAIECKNYNKNIDIPRVRDFARKIEHLSGLKGLMVTKKGFSENAIAEASADNIDLLIIREQRDQDWDGRIKQVNVRIHILSASRTIKIIPTFNKSWMLNNGFKEGDLINYSTTNELIIIEDAASAFKHTLRQLEQSDFFEQKEPGTHVWQKQFQDGWISFDQIKLKLDSIAVEYNKPNIMQQEVNVNFE